MTHASFGMLFVFVAVSVFEFICVTYSYVSICVGGGIVARVQLCVCVQVCVCAQVCMCVSAHTHKNKHTHTQTHTQTFCVFRSLSHTLATHANIQHTKQHSLSLTLSLTVTQCHTHTRAHTHIHTCAHTHTGTHTHSAHVHTSLPPHR